jgi:hypothetical protein
MYTRQIGWLYKGKIRWLPASGPLAGHGGATKFSILIFNSPSLVRRGGVPSGAAAFLAMDAVSGY